MASPQERAQCVVWFSEKKSPITVQRNYRLAFEKDPPDKKTIKAWYDKFLPTGSVLRQSGSCKKRTSDETVEHVMEFFQRSPTKSILRASFELSIPRLTVHKVLHKRLRLFAYEVQIVQALEPNYRPQRQQFVIEMLDRIDQNPNYLSNVMFSDEATFHTCNKVNRHNIRIWGSENPHGVREKVRDSRKVNVWCGMMKDRIIGPFFFIEPTVTRNIYLDMLEQFAVPQLLPQQPNVIFQQDGAPPHWSLDVRDFLDRTFPQRWVGHDGPTKWPPRSPDITPINFFLWGNVNDRVYATPIRDVAELRRKTTYVIRTITSDMLNKTWTEIEYRLDILRATKELMWKCTK
jgi:hypothetical protein